MVCGRQSVIQQNSIEPLHQHWLIIISIIIVIIIVIINVS